MIDELEVDFGAVHSGPVQEAPPLGATLADRLAATQVRKKPPITIALDADPSVAVRYKTVIPLPLREANLKLILAERDQEAHMALLVAQCEAVLIDGNEVIGDDGKPMTFKGLAAEMGVATPADAVTKLYGGADGLAGAVVEIATVANAIYGAGNVHKLKDEKGAPLD